MGRIKSIEAKLINAEIESRIKKECTIKNIGKKLYLKTERKFKENHLIDVMAQNQLCIQITRDKLIEYLLKKETEKVMGKTLNIKENIEETSDEDEQAYNKWRKNNKFKMPTVSSKKMMAFLEKMDEVEVKKNAVEQCTSKMNSQSRLSWNSPNCLMKAITHSILHRKWYNLTKLLLILVHWTNIKLYRPIVFDYCEKILNNYHPLIEESGLKDQFQMILRRKD
ncbi:unnamed protein product [Brassicogethes aeneus]|uniref:Uncharacterized protein n=1 Tax=Brassicogethes aeneus TaxID=1431903 RepID=A0A9P0AYB0_BRAAE|nr:unnamed protein product [Brassicogethes aeneus]